MGKGLNRRSMNQTLTYMQLYCDLIMQEEGFGDVWNSGTGLTSDSRKEIYKCKDWLSQVSDHTSYATLSYNIR
jgi:hypothetical protein